MLMDSKNKAFIGPAQRETRPAARLDAKTNENSTKSDKIVRILAKIAFAIQNIVFFLIGPGLYMQALTLGGFAWALTWNATWLMKPVAVASIITMIIYVSSFILAWIKIKRQNPVDFQNFLTDLSIMLASGVVGLMQFWLSWHGILHGTLLFGVIIRTACIILPIVGLKIARVRRKNIAKTLEALESPSTSSPVQPKQPRLASQETVSILTQQPAVKKNVLIVAVILLAASIAEAGVAVASLVELAVEDAVTEKIRREGAEEEEIEKRRTEIEQKGLDPEVGILGYVLCDGYDYDVIQKLGDKKALIQCTHHLREIYEIGDRLGKLDQEDSYVIRMEAIRFGAMTDIRVDEYIPGQIYLLKEMNKDHPTDVLTMLLPASSPEEVIAKYAEQLHEYSDKALYPNTIMRVRIFFNEDLSDVQPARDLVALWRTYGTPSGFPKYDGGLYTTALGSQFYNLEDPDSSAALEYFEQHPEAISAQARNAMEAHPHFSFKIIGSDEVTLEDLEVLMRESIVEPGEMEDRSEDDDNVNQEDDEYWDDEYWDEEDVEGWDEDDLSGEDWSEDDLSEEDWGDESWLEWW